MTLSKSAISLLAFAPLLLAPAYAAEIEAPFLATSAAGLYHAGLVPEAEPVALNVMQSWTLILTAADGAPIADASVSINGGMPAHGHGLPSAPQVTENLGEGHYRIEGVKFNMSGDWVINLDITAPSGADKVTFQLPL